MTDYKILVQNFPNANEEEFVYNTPSNKSTLVRSINVTNTSGTDDTFDVAIKEDGSVTSAQTQFLAVSSTTGAVLSTDGITWTPTTLATSGSTVNSGLEYGNGRWSMLTTGSSYQYSTDGITWTFGYLASPANKTWQAMAFGNSVFVGTGSSTNLSAHSTDAITWTTGTMPSSGNWYGLAFGNGVFVAIRQSSDAAATSTDGLTWTARTSVASAAWYKLAFGNGVFVAVSNVSAQYSTDGITWTQTTLPPAGGSLFRQITSANNVFYASVRGTSGQFAYSTDGITWTTGTMNSGLSSADRIVHGVNGKWASIMGGGAATTTDANYSTDGITWEQTSMPSSLIWRRLGVRSYVGTSPTQNEDYIFKSKTISGNETTTIKAGYTMSENDQIRVKSTNGTSNFNFFGAEI